MKKQLIILSGGGSGGPVTPLLALAPDLQAAGYELAWVGTESGIERGMVAEAAIDYYAIPAGKLRRYVSLTNLLDAFRVLAGFFAALSLLKRLKPSLVMTAGAFVSVPLVWAAWALRIKIIVHQQDIRPGLANRLMAPFADGVTVTFEKSLKDFGKKAVWTGNPVRAAFRNVVSRKKVGDRPRVLVLGGGTGAAALNELIISCLPQLTAIADVVHVTGGKANKKEAIAGYAAHDFLSEADMAQAMADADLVVTRAGLGTLTELAYLGKPTIIIPMPDSHQEENGMEFSRKRAAVLLEQENLTPESFSSLIGRSLAERDVLQMLSMNISNIMRRDAGNAIVAMVKKII